MYDHMVMMVTDSVTDRLCRTGPRHQGSGHKRVRDTVELGF